MPRVTGTPTTSRQAVVGAATRTIELARRRFDAAARVRAVRELIPLLKAAQRELRSRLARVAPGDSFTAVQASAFRAQIAAVINQLSRELGISVTRLMQGASNESVSVLAAQINGMQRRLAAAGMAVSDLTTIPLTEVTRLTGTLGRDTSLLQEFYGRGNASARSYGQALIIDFEKDVGVGLATGMTTDQIADRLVRTNGTFRNAWWRAERIARTESSWAFNRSHREAAERLDEDFDDTLLRWTEFVDDASGAPLDNRVAEDSIALHGQLRLPGDPFYDEVNGVYVNEPPNRPNDRATLLTWRASWGEPPGGIAGLDPDSLTAWDAALANAKKAGAVPEDGE